MVTPGGIGEYNASLTREQQSEHGKRARAVRTENEKARKTMAALALEIVHARAPNDKVAELKGRGVETDGTVGAVVVGVAFVQAMDGDRYARDWVRDMVGEKPVDGIDVVARVGALSDEDRALLEDARNTYAAGG